MKFNLAVLYRNSFTCLLKLTFFCCLLLSINSSAALTQQGETVARAIFPKLTRIGEMQPNPDVTPVYQLDQLLGYVYETNDLTDLPGFSGERINLLVGLDVQGAFAGLQVLNHHEPIFMHGLGEGPMHQFVDQYRGRSVTDRIIIDSRYVGSEENNGTVYIDGVTKATVSVLVINDTVQASAMAVARAKLEGFSQSAPAVARMSLMNDYSWEQLLQQGLVKRWLLSSSDLNNNLPQDISLYSDPELEQAIESESFSSLYYAYLNVPSIGRNLLGDAEFERLMAVLRPGEHALLVAADEGYSFVGPEFRRGTVPSRLGLQQNGLPIDIRDLDFVDDAESFVPAQGVSLPRFHIFRIKAQSGFDPSQLMALQLNLDLVRNHLIQDKVSFSDSYVLPELYFDKPEQSEVAAPQPLWQRLWQGRWLEIVLLSLLLVVVTLVFVYQHRLSARAVLFSRLRWSLLLISLLFVGIYSQGQLSVVNIYTLMLALINGFDIEVFLLDPVIFILWSYVFVTLFLWGRGVFCGWLCPFGVMQEMLSKVTALIGIKQLKLSPLQHRILQKLKYIILAGLLVTAYFSLSLAEQLAEVEPFKTAVTLAFVRSWPFVLYAIGLLVAGLFVHKFFCRYLCPLGAGLAILGRFSLFRWLDRRKECGSPCQLCKVRCGIDSINRDGSIDYDECIQCMECIVILNNPNSCAIEMSQRKKQIKSQQRETVRRLDATMVD